MPKRHVGIVVLLALGLPVAATAQHWLDYKAGFGEEALRRVRLRTALLGGQNEARVAVGVAPLAWDGELETHARRQAEQMARSGRFEHSHDGDRREGENLWTGTRGAYAPREMVGHWVEERSAFANRPVPAAASGDWSRVAHYSQVVWRGTTRVGCAVASNAAADYLVCRYASPGNVVGERAL